MRLIYNAEMWAIQVYFENKYIVNCFYYNIIKVFNYVLRESYKIDHANLLIKLINFPLNKKSSGVFLQMTGKKNYNKSGILTRIGKFCNWILYSLNFATIT